VFVDGELMSIIVGVIQDALSETTTRTEESCKAIELVLTLLRNLLSIPDTPQADTHARLICVLKDHDVLDVILYLTQVLRDSVALAPNAATRDSDASPCALLVPHDRTLIRATIRC